MKAITAFIGGLTVVCVTIVGGAVAAFVAAIALAPYVLILLLCAALAKYLGWL